MMRKEERAINVRRGFHLVNMTSQDYHTHGLTVAFMSTLA